VAAYIIRFLLVYVCCTDRNSNCTTVTLASSNNALHDDGDSTETYRRCFIVNFNVNFKIVLRHLACAAVGE
jgi:hypothetical protein